MSAYQFWWVVGVTAFVAGGIAIGIFTIVKVGAQRIRDALNSAED